MPKLFIIAGPNGVGKTTFFRRFLPQEMKCWQFLNADAIAAGLSPFAPERAAVAAGRLMLTRLDELIDARENFGFETTLSGRGYVRFLEKAKAAGYHISLYFLWVPGLSLTQKRVVGRVRKGGHDIPDEVQRRRFGVGVQNLARLYRPLLDYWRLYENSAQFPIPIVEEDAGRLNVLSRERLERLEQICDVSLMPDRQPPMVEERSFSNAELGAAADRALRLAYADAVIENLRWGVPMVEYKNDQVVEVPAESRAAYARRVLELKGEPMDRAEQLALLGEIVE